MVKSMTGFAAQKAAAGEVSWTWELRSVNARGMDVRLRLPEGLDGLEALVRKEIGKRVARGNLTLALRLKREAETGVRRPDQARIGAVLDALAEISTLAAQRGIELAPASAAEVLAQSLAAGRGDEPEDELAPAVFAESLTGLLDEFEASRSREGAEMARVLSGHLITVRGLLEQVRDALAERSAETAQNFREALGRVLANTDAADPDRVAQELAILAVKADITEELDRLDAHVKAAEELLAGAGPVGRKLDFLMQEFNREANTLCSKSGHADLTRIGLDLKAVIDQMREQVQNVE